MLPCCALLNITREPLVRPLLERANSRYFSSVSASSNVKSFGFDFSR